jgi:hypothetical protein
MGLKSHGYLKTAAYIIYCTEKFIVAFEKIFFAKLSLTLL